MDKETIKELTWPSIMFLASALNVSGALVAIAMGANKTFDGKVNPFFFTAMAASTLYAIANADRMRQIAYKEKPVRDIESGLTFVERVTTDRSITL